MKTSIRNLGIASLAFAIHCGGGQTTGTAFDSRWSNDEGVRIAAFQQDFSKLEVPLGVDVAIGVAGKTEIVAVSLDGQSSNWTFTHPLDSRPVLVGSVVVGLGAGDLFALDAKTGKRLWSRAAGGSLRGAGDDGKTTVVSLSPTELAASTILAVDHSGRVLRQLEDESAIGVPAVVGRYAFLPWQGQYISIIDLQEGGEVARGLLRIQTSHAVASGGALFFGEQSLVRFDDQIKFTTANRASLVSLPIRELPGTPRWMALGTDKTPVEATALDRIRLYARPAAQGPVGLENSAFVGTYFRIAVGLDGKSGALRWVHTNDTDILGGSAYRGGFALCDKEGKVHLIDAESGAPTGLLSLGKPVDSCVVQTEGLSKAKKPASQSIGEALTKALFVPQSEHVMIQRFLLRELAGLNDELATKTLVDLASSDRTAPLLLEDARKALAARRNGVSYMLAALEKHYDFLSDVLRPPPVGPLADALLALNEPRAAALLASHLNDPADTPDDESRAARALAGLATPSERVKLMNFFAMYRGLDGDEAIAAAVESAGVALQKIGDGVIVAKAATDPQTSEPVRVRLEAIVKRAQPGAQAEPAPPKSAPSEVRVKKPGREKKK